MATRLLNNQQRTPQELAARASRDALMGSAVAQQREAAIARAAALARDKPELAVKGFFSYTVVSGDTLGGIANEYYGDWRAFPDVWTINHRNRNGPLGDNPNVVNIGDVLRLADTRAELEAESGLTEVGRQNIIDGTGDLPLPSEMTAAELDEPEGMAPPAEGFIRGTLLTPKGLGITAAIIGGIFGIRKLIKARA